MRLTELTGYFTIQEYLHKQGGGESPLFNSIQNQSKNIIMKKSVLKNKTSHGFKLTERSDERYQLRKRVMGMIYKAKKLVELPRIEVRVVDGGKDEVCGYAYLNSNIVHINKDYVNKSDEFLYHLVLHELVHSVTGFRHDEDCYLMNPIIKSLPIVSKSEKAFLKYFK